MFLFVQFRRQQSSHQDKNNWRKHKTAAIPCPHWMILWTWQSQSHVNAQCMDLSLPWLQRRGRIVQSSSAAHLKPTKPLLQWHSSQLTVWCWRYTNNTVTNEIQFDNRHIIFKYFVSTLSHMQLHLLTCSCRSCKCGSTLCNNYTLPATSGQTMNLLLPVFDPQLHMCRVAGLYIYIGYQSSQK